MMKAVVTGATGFIGRHLLGRLLSKGFEVQVLLRESSDASSLPASVGVHRYGPASPTLAETVERIRPDIVFHLAARFQTSHQPEDVAGLIESNITFGSALADALVRAGCYRMVNTGTSWQHFGIKSDSPVCLYAATKTAFEAILSYFSDARNLSVITLKLFDTYGPHDRRPKVLSLFDKIARSGVALEMSPGDQLIDLVHVNDVLDCFLMAAERLSEGLVDGIESYAVSSGAPIRLRDLATLFSQVSGTPLAISWSARPYREREVMIPWDQGQPLPGWSPRIKLEEGLAAMFSNV